MTKFKRKNPKYISDPNNKKARSWSEYKLNLEDQKERELESDIQKKLKLGQL